MLAPGEVYRPLVPKKLVAIFRKGQVFGETDILYGQKRQSTLVSSGIGTLIAVPRKEYLVRSASLKVHGMQPINPYAMRAGTAFSVAQ